MGFSKLVYAWASVFLLAHRLCRILFVTGVPYRRTGFAIPSVTFYAMSDAVTSPKTLAAGLQNAFYSLSIAICLIRCADEGGNLRLRLGQRSLADDGLSKLGSKAINLTIFPFALSLSKGERKIPTALMLSRSWFDRLTTNGLS
jgi:hypothetical protein